VREYGVRKSLRYYFFRHRAPKYEWIECWQHDSQQLQQQFSRDIEALEGVPNKEFFLRVMYSKGQIFICTQNNFNNEIVYDKNKEIASSKSSVDRGLGLRNILKTIERYGGFMEVTHTDNVFSISILIPLS